MDERGQTQASYLHEKDMMEINVITKEDLKRDVSQKNQPNTTVIVCNDHDKEQSHQILQRKEHNLQDQA